MAADNSSQNLSWSLYHYLCQNIVGYEEHVNTIRLMNDVRDDLSKSYTSVNITSGSFGEGLEMDGSDIDIMEVSKTIEVYENKSSENQDKYKTYFSMNMEETKPGFTYLFLEFVCDADVFRMCVKVGGKMFLSNALFKQKLATETLSVEHGPCLSDRNGYFDYALSLHSKSWVTPASQWITRTNDLWPTADVKQNIIDHGILFVPIGVKGSKNEEIEWRLSFSVGEKLLIYTFSHTQLLCYALLKILLRDVISIDVRCKDLLCSYFLKTIMLWISEELQPSVWTPDNLIPCFMRCFRRLVYCVNYSVCPLYFITENNLFENKIEGVERQILLNNLFLLYRHDWKCILFSPQIQRFEFVLNQQIPFLAHTDSFKVVNSKGLLLLTKMVTHKAFRKNYFRSIHNLVCAKSTRLQHINVHYMSVLCNEKSQTIPIGNIYMNKDKYDQYHSCLYYLLQNIHHDAVSGWLMLASFFYKLQQYEQTMEILAYSLSKCTLEKICFGIDFTKIHFELLRLRTIKEKGIINSLKALNVNNCCFTKKSSLIPIELQLEVDNNDYVVPPVVYAHFLRFLCHYHLSNTRQCWESIRDLQLTIAEEYFIQNIDVLKALSYNCLGVALQLLGETKNAQQIFLKSIDMWPEPHLNTAFKRLSLISLL